MINLAHLSLVFFITTSFHVSGIVGQGEAVINTTTPKSSFIKDFNAKKQNSIRDWWTDTILNMKQIALKIKLATEESEKALIKVFKLSRIEGQQMVKSLFKEVKTKIINKTIKSTDSLSHKISENTRSLRENYDQIQERKVLINEQILADQVEKEVRTKVYLPLSLRNQMTNLAKAIQKKIKEIGSRNPKLLNHLDLIEDNLLEFQTSIDETSDDMKLVIDSYIEHFKKETADDLRQQLLDFISKNVDREMFVSNYSPNDITNLCSINNITFTGPISMVASVCDIQVREVVGNEALTFLKMWLQDLDDGVENYLVDVILKKNMSGLVQLLPQMFPSSGIKSNHVESLTDLIAPFSTEELTDLISAAQNANIIEEDLLVLEELYKTVTEDWNNFEKLITKINVKSLPEISKNLLQLEIKLTDIFTNPSIIYDFFGDDKKFAIFQELQGLLPKFRPKEVETLLKFQRALEDSEKKLYGPGSPTLITKMLAVPTNILFLLVNKLKMGGSLKGSTHAIKLIAEDPSIKQLLKVRSKLQDSDNQMKILEECGKQHLDISCTDKKLQLYIDILLRILNTLF